MKQNLLKHKGHFGSAHTNPPIQSSRLHEVGHSAEDCKQQHAKTKKQENEDLDWLEQIVHQFQFYKDLQDSSLFKDKQQTVEKSHSVEGLLQKVGLNANLYRNSQRKQGQENRKNITTRPKQIKHQIVHKILAPKNGILPVNAKVKRSESEGSGFPKRKDPRPNNNKQKVKFSETHKQITQAFKKNCDVIQFCGLRDAKEDLIKMKNKLSMPETKNSLGKVSKVIVMKENRKNLLETINDNKTVGKIVKNKSIELKQKKNTFDNEQSQTREKSSRNQIENFLSRSREKNVNKIQVNFQKQNQSVKNNLSQIQIQRKQPLREQILNIEQSLAESARAPAIRDFQKQESRQTKDQTITLKNTQNKKFNYLSQKSLESRYEKLWQKKQRKLNSSFGDRKIPQLITINDEEKNDLKKLQAVLEHQDEHSQAKKQDQLRVQKQQGSNRTLPESLSMLYNKVKLVESTKNSQVLTEHSIVIDKNQIGQGIEGESMRRGEDWNIMQIFQKLDKQRSGCLSSHNCQIENISREIRLILGVVIQEILYRGIQYNFPQFIARVQEALESVKDINPQSQLHPPQNEWKPVPQGPPPSPAILSVRPQTTKENGNHKVLESKKYEYSKIFVEDILTEPSHKKNSDSSQVIRFATFQDEDINAGEEESKGVGQRQLFRNGNGEKVRPRDMQKLQIKLEGLSQFKSKYDHQSKHLRGMADGFLITNRTNGQCTHRKAEAQQNMDSKNEDTKFRPRSYSEVGKKDYKSEIVKLQMLNERLQKYLHAQNMKQFSSSKLLIG